MDAFLYSTVICIFQLFICINKYIFGVYFVLQVVCGLLKFWPKTCSQKEVREWCLYVLYVRNKHYFYNIATSNNVSARPFSHNVWRVEDNSICAMHQYNVCDFEWIRLLTLIGTCGIVIKAAGLTVLYNVSPSKIFFSIDAFCLLKYLICVIYVAWWSKSGQMTGIDLPTVSCCFQGHPYYHLWTICPNLMINIFNYS